MAATGFSKNLCSLSEKDKLTTYKFVIESYVKELCEKM